MPQPVARTEITREEWQVEQLRCTAFLLPQTVISADEVFHAIAGTDAITRAENRQAMTSSAGGTLDTIKMDVVCVPGRIDVLFQPGDDVPSGAPVVGAYLASKELFVDVVGRWLRLRPPLQRLALGVLAVTDVTDRPEGYRLLQKLLPSVQLDPDHSSDLIYQINRPRLVKVAEDFRVPINRLSRWGVMLSMVHTLHIHSQETIAQTQPVLTRSRCRVDLDLNSDTTVTELPAQHLDTLWTALSGLADEILFKGDLP